MKLHILFLLFVGCAAVPKSLPIPIPDINPDHAVSITPAPAAFVKQSRTVITPTPSITWTWNPGDYTNFVVITSTDLTSPLNQWATYLTTTENSFQAIPDEPQRFFTLYGTNSDGDSAWVTKSQ